MMQFGSGTLGNLFDPVRFATFRLEYGELVWGDYDLRFTVFDLYRNQIERHASLETVA